MADKVNVEFVSPVVRPEFGDTQSMAEWVAFMKGNKKLMTKEDFKVYTAGRKAYNNRVLYDKRKDQDAYALKMREKERVSQSLKINNFSIWFIF